MSETLTFADLRAALAGTPFKILDTTRKDVLRLPPYAAYVWLVHWMHEGYADESYLSLNRLVEITGLSKPTIIKWRNYLIEYGWLKETGQTAADKYENPTRGAHNVLVVRVNDPSKGGKNSLPPPEPGSNCFTPKLFTQVSGSGSGSGSSSSSTSPSGSVSDLDQPLRGEKQGVFEGVSQPTPKPTPKATSTSGADAPVACGDSPVLTNTGVPVPDSLISAQGAPVLRQVAPALKVGKPKAAPDGTPYPADFEQQSNSVRIAWLYLHTPEKERKELKRGFNPYEFLCAGIGAKKGKCWAWPHRKIDKKQYCAECKPWTEKDLKQEEERKRKEAEENDDSPEAAARRRRKWVDMDAEREIRERREQEAKFAEQQGREPRFYPIYEWACEQFDMSQEKKEEIRGWSLDPGMPGYEEANAWRQKWIAKAESESLATSKNEPSTP